MKVTRKKRSGLDTGFRPERCYKCGESYTPGTTKGPIKCRCYQGKMPRGPVWINGILRPIDGCDNCGSTLHSACYRKPGIPVWE